MRDRKRSSITLAKKSTAKFHYIKTVSGKVVAQSIAFRVVSIFFPLKSWLHVTHHLLKAASFDTFCLVAPVAKFQSIKNTRMWANAQPDGRPAEHRWRPLFNAAKFG